MEGKGIIFVKDKVGEIVKVVGWASSLRKQSKITFCDLRDMTATLQCIFVGDLKDVLENILEESVIEIEGEVIQRGENMVNTDQALGTVELKASSVKVLSPSEALPFPIGGDTRGIDEEVRMKYRYLDLRSGRMQENMRKRHEATLFMRNYLSDNSFIEVETPHLTKGTPEGAREYIVPSRVQKGQFYVLPQSPQQFKQLLMVGGIERYFQFAKCFRDEDLREDRQPEFTQLDMEMSFTDEEEVMKVTEDAVIKMVQKVFPDKKIKSTPFPKMTYKEAMEQHKSDKPNIQEGDELAFLWVTDFPLFEDTDEGKTSVHHPFTKPKGDNSASYDLVLNGYEVGGGSIRIFDQEEQRKIFKELNLSDEEMEKKFGHLLEAFKFGVPPHGGIALGWDRLISTILGEKSIRETIAFPKTGSGKDLMVGAPSDLPEDKLGEAGIKKA